MTAPVSTLDALLADCPSMPAGASTSAVGASTAASLAADEQTEGDFSRFSHGPTRARPHDYIYAAFQSRCDRHPMLPAIEHLGEALSYRELQQQAESVALDLQALGVSRGERVGLFIQRGIPMVVGLLAVLKLRATCVTQDPTATSDSQLRRVISEADVRVMLSTVDLSYRLAGRVRMLAVAPMCALTLPAAARPRPGGEDTADTCCVLYTAGTGGMSSGVLLSQRSLCNLVLLAPGHLGIRPGTRVGQLLAIDSGMAIWEIFACLCNGGTLAMLGPELAATAATLDVMIATPSLLSRLSPADCPGLRLVALAGERCPLPLAHQWSAHCALYIGFGTTEAGIVSTLSRHLHGDTFVNVGAPTPNNSVYVLDEALLPCPTGEIGEVWAGGDGPGAGYVAAAAALATERFRPDPFDARGRRMVRTSDLGRWTADGRLELIGRLEDQLDTPEGRVQADRLATALEQGAGCARATTLKVGDHELIVFLSPGSADAAVARTIVDKLMPRSGRPVPIMTLDRLPMDRRGRIDRHLLLCLALPLFMAS